MDMMIFLRRIIVWMSRICYCRGFGIQSPNDYAFVRYVINEHYPYYAYSDLIRAYPGIDSEHRRVCEFYLRLANFLQPSVIANFHDEPYFESYLRAGCSSADILCDVDTCGSVNLAILPLGDKPRAYYAPLCEEMMNRMTEKSVLVLHGIHSNREARSFWRMIQSDGRVGVTFDLYYLGVVFFDTKRYKHNYIVNF